MSVKLSAQVIDGGPNSEKTTHYFVRSVAVRVGTLSGGERDTDGWAAYVEAPVLVTGDQREALGLGAGDGIWLALSERLSSPKATPEEATEHMYAAVRAHLSRGGRLHRSAVPELQLTGPDPLGDA